MLQGYTMAIVPCSNPTPKKLPTGGGEWPTFRTARAQRTVRPLYMAEMGKMVCAKKKHVLSPFARFCFFFGFKLR